MSKIDVGVAGGIAGVVGLAVAGIKLAKKLTEAKAEKCRKDLDDSLRKSENIADDVEEEEKQKD